MSLRCKDISDLLNRDCLSTVTNKLTETHKPIKQGKPFSQEAKAMIVHVFHAIAEDFPMLTKTQHMQKTAKYTGCAERSLYRFLREEQENGSVQPPKKRKIEKIIQLNDEHKRLIKKIVQTLKKKNGGATLTAIHAEIMLSKELPPMGRTTVHNLLKELKIK